MAYTKGYTLDATPGGDTVKEAIVTKIDGLAVDRIFSYLNSHEALTTGAHGVGAGTIVGTTLTQTLTNKTLTTPVIASIYIDAAKTKLMSFPDVASDTIVLVAAAQTLTNKTLTTPTIGDFTNATHAHEANSSGGQLDKDALTFSATDKVLGRQTAGAGTGEEISCTAQGRALIAAALGQVPFPASQNASADANTLDDYEEGTWTPAVGGTATYTLQSGTYTKIGRLVFITMRLTINVIGTGSQTTISGLPFAAAAAAGMGVGYWANLAVGIVYAGALAGGTDLSFYSATAATAGLAVNNIFGDGSDIILSGAYYV